MESSFGSRETSLGEMSKGIFQVMTSMRENKTPREESEKVTREEKRWVDDILERFPPAFALYTGDNNTNSDNCHVAKDND